MEECTHTCDSTWSKSQSGPFGGQTIASIRNLANIHRVLHIVSHIFTVLCDREKCAGSTRLGTLLHQIIPWPGMAPGNTLKGMQELDWSMAACASSRPLICVQESSIPNAMHMLRDLDEISWYASVVLHHLRHVSTPSHLPVASGYLRLQSCRTSADFAKASKEWVRNRRTKYTKNSFFVRECHCLSKLIVGMLVFRHVGVIRCSEVDVSAESRSGAAKLLGCVGLPTVNSASRRHHNMTGHNLSLRYS